MTDYSVKALDAKAKDEISTIPSGRRKAFVYRDLDDTIAVGNAIHVMLAGQLAPNATRGVAGFIERTEANHLAIIHWPQSPVDFSSPELLQDVRKKLSRLGYNATLRTGGNPRRS